MTMFTFDALQALAAEIIAEQLLKKVILKERLEASLQRGWGTVTAVDGTMPLDDTVRVYGLLRIVGNGAMSVYAVPLPDGYVPRAEAQDVIEIHTDLPLDITLKVDGLPIMVAAQIRAIRDGTPPETLVASIHRCRERRTPFAKWLLTECGLRMDGYRASAA